MTRLLSVKKVFPRKQGKSISTPDDRRLEMKNVGFGSGENSKVPVSGTALRDIFE